MRNDKVSALHIADALSFARRISSILFFKKEICTCTSVLQERQVPRHHTLPSPAWEESPECSRSTFLLTKQLCGIYQRRDSDDGHPLQDDLTFCRFNRVFNRDRFPGHPLWAKRCARHWESIDKIDLRPRWAAFLVRETENQSDNVITNCDRCREEI